MHPRRIAAINAILFFFFWLFVLLAGADFPPPPGFLFLIIVIAACAYVVYWRVPTYIDWHRSQRPRRQWHVLLEGIAAGIVVAIPFVLIGIGDSSMTPQPVDYAIWFAIVGFMGALNSLAIYFLNTLVVRILDPVQ
jgi:drug/metabolite transporter (DMT)-like permease